MKTAQLSFTKVEVATHRAARCMRCHRVLSDPVSMAIGLGPVCRGQQRRGSSKEDFEMDLCKRDEFSDKFDNSVPFRQALVMKREAGWNSETVGGVITNVPHLVVHHSPNGYEFGYGGSGPADLALNVCQLYLNVAGYEGRKTKCYDGQCWTLAYMLHQDFKRDFIALVPKTGMSIPFEMIDLWFKGHMTDELIKSCSLVDEYVEEEG